MVAKEVSETELTGAGVKIGGSVAGLVGTGMLITGKFEQRLLEVEELYLNVIYEGNHVDIGG